MSKAAAPLDIDPWEQQPNESAVAYQAFVLYRDMGADGSKRSTTRVAQTCGKHVRLITRWSARWRWVDRVREYDRHLDRLARLEREREIVAFRRRAATQARGKAQSLLLPDMAISAKLSKPGALEELQNLSLPDLIALSVRSAVPLPNLLRAEALALGDVTDRHETATTDVDTDTDALTKAIQASDDLLSMAATIVERASADGARSRALAAVGVRDGGIAGEVAVSEAPDVSEPEAGGVSTPQS